jgi:L-aspartate oxidase
VDAALRRKESRGGHYRSDFPHAKRTWQGRHIEM